MLRDLLGLELRHAPVRRGNKVTLQWLRGHFNGQVEETDTQVQIEQKARGYIMQLIEGVLVLDESSSRVYLCYLELWERQPYLAPGRVGDRPPRQGAALIGRWDDKFHSPDLATHVVGHYRHSLDMQKPDEVIWQPYKDGLIELLPPFCSAGRNIWRAKVPLINFNIIEMHQPERVMRQFGYRQLPLEPSCVRDRSHGMEMKKHSHNWADEHRVHVERWENRLQYIVPEGEPDIVGAYPDEDEYVTWYKRITVPFVSQMSASLDKAMNLFTSLISTDLSERVQAVGRQGLMCIVAQEKFLRKEPPVHGVWIPPAMVEEEEVVEDHGNGGVHADEEVGVGANVEAAEGEQHDGHGHGEAMVAQPHPQQEDHPMPMLHISPGIALSPFFTTPTDVHDGSGGETSFVDALMANRMKLDSAQGDKMQDHEYVQESVQLVQGQALLQVEGHDELPPNVPVEGHDELPVEVPVEEHDQLAAEVQVEVLELRRGMRTRRRPQCGTDRHKGLRKGKHRH
ncbi:hypothetical protein Vadar_026158 [Vaccinium darrowii]|uniref:Uncharacterized protein n=1 Tax=Vaccinium darrowii TaxID=229202 RepID=A0ACB7ZEE4_9ERIC|nr:hypothetical protein Vadar_026158 [Vaccinium darrowii]